MSEPNYNETVVIPLLESRCKQLLSNNLILEASVLVEQARVRWLNEQLGIATEKLSKSKKKTVEKLDGETY